MKDKNKIDEELESTTKETSETKESTDDVEIAEEKVEQKEHKAPLGERIEDAMDEVVAGVQDFFYGPREDYNHDIPATMPDPDNEIRHINKVQTRRNFNKRLFGKKGALIFLIGMGVVMLIGFLVSKFG